MPSALKLLDQKFGRLLVVGLCQERRRNNIVWLCRCDCGNEVKVPGKDLRYGNTSSCGCLQKEVAAQNAASTRTHGMSHKTYLYGIWSGIKDRCYNINDPAYINYGGRGINMCVEWLNDFAQFAKDVGDRPSEEYTLDRVDNNLGYQKIIVDGLQRNCNLEIVENLRTTRQELQVCMNLLMGTGLLKYLR